MPAAASTAHEMLWERRFTQHMTTSSPRPTDANNHKKSYKRQRGMRAVKREAEGRGNANGKRARPRKPDVYDIALGGSGDATTTTATANTLQQRQEEQRQQRPKKRPRHTTHPEHVGRPHAKTATQIRSRPSEGRASAKVKPECKIAVGNSVARTAHRPS